MLVCSSKKVMLLFLALLMMLVSGCGGSNVGKVSYPDGKIAWAAHSALSGVPKELHDGVLYLWPRACQWLYRAE